MTDASGTWDAVRYRPIGVIHTSFREPAGTPIQATSFVGSAGHVEIDPALAPGLRDLEAFSHLILLYHLHRVGVVKLTVKPFLDDREHGVFATRAPARPNPIGLSVVRLVGIEGTRLDIEDVDMIDGTPLLDLKPYVPAFDARDDVRVGWYADRLDHLEGATADDRFR
jgi:tRNA-Thr(GGU) m(6)t(6)A37 methyltransferase TsaA